MLWFDNDLRTSLDSKIQKAAQYYRNKYGRAPDLCLVHPTMLIGDQNNPKLDKPALSDARAITVRSYKPVLPGHIWIGVEDQG
jgi:hypothetical protein